MTSNTSNKTSKLRTALAIALIAAAGPAAALGLGQIQVKSRLDQPLLAEIPIISSDPAELERLGIAVACAPRVMPTPFLMRSGIRSGSALAVAGPSQSTPAVATTDSWNPRAPARLGSASSSTTTARERARQRISRKVALRVALASRIPVNTTPVTEK